MKNIVLIGMPGTGKSVVGRALAQRLDYTFVDADDVIVEQSGKTLPEILRTEGLETFLEIEERVGRTMEFENTVIATGGSMVLSEAAMEHLKESSVIIWLETPLSQISGRMPEDLTDRGIAAPAGMTLRGDEVSWRDTSKPGQPHEANFLKLDSSRVRMTLGWKPVWKMEDAIRAVVEWSRAYLDGADTITIMEKQIKEYIEKLC